MNDSNKIHKAIINKALLIFKMVFSDKEDSSINGQQVEEIKLSESSSQDTISDETHILYIEELLSQGKLVEFINRVCEDHKSNQVLQDSWKELINLLEVCLSRYPCLVAQEKRRCWSIFDGVS
jgi:hypothetical protein